MKHISYDKGDYGYQITVYPPSGNYPMYQVGCNDEEYFGVWVFPTEEATNSFVDMVLSHSEGCVLVAVWHSGVYGRSGAG